MASKKMGFEGLAYYGVAGSTAATLLTNTRDMAYNLATDKGDTTVRGDGTAPPIGTSRVTRRNFTITFNMVNKEGDTALEAMRVAAYAGTPVAIRMKDYASGKGYDGDVILECDHGKPLGGEQTYDFTAEPNDDLRTPLPYV